MPFPQSPFSSLRARRPQATDPHDRGLVLGVGRRAFAAGGPRGFVTLTDDNGAVALGSLADGEEVEILAWVPRRAATRYRVRSLTISAQGWLGAASLRAGADSKLPQPVAEATTASRWIVPQAPQGPPTAGDRKATSRALPEVLGGGAGAKSPRNREPKQIARRAKAKCRSAARSRERSAPLVSMAELAKVENSLRRGEIARDDQRACKEYVGKIRRWLAAGGQNPPEVRRKLEQLLGRFSHAQF